ncbi:hypothetical protein C161_30866 [Paenibacillus sp. FSL R5-192]|uniref:hypothetical protein n=1 Tax=unclassified Paenibacillus TaxID=185978 RepID=UPI0003E223D8|nr:hypothetical protein [Paenibacillus sp. FSL R5-192]ETT29522.1 hypothetical protein C161_30866 [Paenibacillus sp. FSL R5-192]
MREESLSREVRYGKKDIAELESASIQVHLIYKKAAELFKRTAYSRSVKDDLAEVNTHSVNSDGPKLAPAVLQKWIQTSRGWKCIGCELGQPDSTMSQMEETMHAKQLALDVGEGRLVEAEMLIQAVVWSQYEKIRMFAPWLGDEPFYSVQELDVIARYIVPTYFSERPLHEQGKVFKVHQQYGQIPLYQEYVDAPSCCVQVDGGLLEGRLLTGVYVSEEQFFGLNPYLKDGDGGRTYMQACVQ